MEGKKGNDQSSMTYETAATTAGPFIAWLEYSRSKPYILIVAK